MEPNEIWADSLDGEYRKKMTVSEEAVLAISAIDLLAKQRKIL